MSKKRTKSSEILIHPKIKKSRKLDIITSYNDDNYRQEFVQKHQKKIQKNKKYNAKNGNKIVKNIDKYTRN